MNCGGKITIGLKSKCVCRRQTLIQQLETTKFVLGRSKSFNVRLWERAVFCAVPCEPFKQPVRDELQM